MTKHKINLNSEVTNFLDGLNHPFRKEIEQLRNYILTANNNLTESIKWNGPNYCFDNNDRITMRINPPKQIQVIFHCGAKVQEQPKGKLIKENFDILHCWRVAHNEAYLLAVRLFSPETKPSAPWSFRKPFIEGASLILITTSFT